MALPPVIAFVSDENFVALADVAVEIQFLHGGGVAITRSSARGAVHADLPPGDYFVTLNKTGYGAKRVRASIDPAAPVQFRLLSDSLYGYAWPKWVRAGQPGEFRVH